MDEYSRRMNAWGQGFGRGCRGPPGSWPADVDLEAQNRDLGGMDAGLEAMGTGGQYAVSQAKYKAAEAKIKELAQKQVELAKLRDAAGGGEAQEHGSEKGQSLAMRTASGLEDEIRVLERMFDRLNLEADEQYAKELAEEEEQG